MRSIFSDRQSIHERIFLFSSILIVVTLPFSLKLNSLAIVLLTINWIVEGNWRNKLALLKKNQFVLIMSAFYVYHIIGLLYTENLKQGLFELEKRIACLILPLVFGTNVNQITRKVTNLILAAFVIACTVAAIICSLNAGYHWSKGDPSYLYYHKLGSPINFVHAVYFSFYVSFSFFIVLFSLLIEWINCSKGLRILLFLIALFLLVFLIFLSSKTIIAATFVALIIFSFIHIRNSEVLRTGIVTLTLVVIGVLGFIVANNSAISSRFHEIMVDDYNQENPLFLDDYQGYHFTGGTIRFAIWKTIVEIVNKERAWLYGVGTGDTQDMLTAAYIEKHVYPGDEELGTEGFLSYNAHNQFFQFYLALGGVGLILFGYILFILWKSAWVFQGYWFLSFLFLFTTFCMTESVLCLQKGIMLFSFFSSLFVNGLFKNED